jgi:hypothetical protein
MSHKMIIPETWPSLEEFTLWYTENNFPIRVPETAKVYPTDVSYSCCIFRQDVYQVEIYLGAPNFVSSKHAHPFEQKIIFLGGHLSGSRGVEDISSGTGSLGSPITENSSSELPHPDTLLPGTILSIGHWHQVISHNQGFIFLNCQKWQSKNEMTSAVVHYEGDPLGSIHEKLIDENKK